MDSYVNFNFFQAFGVSFRVSTQAKGGKFYLVNLAMNIGSGLGLLAMVSPLNQNYTTFS